MKRFIPIQVGTALIALSLVGNLAAETLPPGQIDFSKFASLSREGEFVDVNLGSTLISLAAGLVQKQEPDIAKLLNGLLSVRVNVFNVSEQNQEELGKRSRELREELQGQGWERIVSAQQKDQEVGVYVKTQGKDTVQGVVVLVMDGNRQAVLANVVGNIKPEQLSVIGERLHIDPLKKLGHAVEKPEKPEN